MRLAPTLLHNLHLLLTVFVVDGAVAERREVDEDHRLVVRLRLGRLDPRRKGAS